MHIMPENQEYILVQRLKEGEEAAFKEIYLSFYNAVYYFISKYLEDTDVIRDLTQEAFFLLWKNRDRLNQSIGYKSYLLSIAKNLMLNRIRSDKYGQKYKETLIKKAQETLLKNELEGHLFNRIENNNLLSIVYSEIDKLPQKQKDVVILSKMRHYTNKEIAQELGISVKTVEYRLMCALRKIRKIIEC